MTEVYMSERARRAAKSLAIRNAAFWEARQTDHKQAAAYWAAMLAEAQAETGIELVPFSTLSRYASLANPQEPVSHLPAI